MLFDTSRGGKFISENLPISIQVIYRGLLEYRQFPCLGDRQSSSRVAYVSRTEDVAIPPVI